MIKGFQPPEMLEPASGSKLEWSAAVKAGLVAGVIFLMVPQGSPWSGLALSSPVIMGRTLPPNLQMPLVMVWLVHMAISVLYGVIISSLVVRLMRARAVLTGGLIGLALYLANFGLVSVVQPDLRGSEGVVVFTHFVFGLVAAAMYRGFLHRARVVVEH